MVALELAMRFESHPETIASCLEGEDCLLRLRMGVSCDIVWSS